MTTSRAALWRLRARSALTAALVLACSGGEAIAATAARSQTPPARPQTCGPEGELCQVLIGLTIDGVTAYALKDLAPLYADYLTRQVSVADLARIAQAITDKYRADGYFLARAVVPAQTGPEGLAHLVVYEGRVSEVRVTGPAARAAEALLGGVTHDGPLRLAELDRRLTLATDRPGMRLTSRLEPVLEDPAQHRLIVQADRDAVAGSLYLDNRGTEAAGPWQAYGRLAANSAFAAGDQLAAAILTVPADPKEFSLGEASYVYPLRTGGSLGLRISGSHARDGSARLGAVIGNDNRLATVRLTHPLARGRRYAVWGAVSFDATRVQQDWDSRQGSRIGGYEDNLRVLRASVFATRQTGGRTTSGFAQISRGVDLLGASDAPGVTRSRQDADGQFWKVNLLGSHYRDLGRRAGLYLQAEGQWSPDALLASEEFTAGAQPYGRAYNYGEIAGEKGAAGLVELRYGFDPNGQTLSFFQLYAFADAAKVWRKGTAPGFGSAALRSAGFGTRLTFARKATLSIEAARPLTRTPYIRTDKHWRPFVALSAGF